MKCVWKDSKCRFILCELGQHLPYSIFGVIISLIIVGVLTFFAILIKGEHLLTKASEELFHIFHPLHILLSATATTSMFWIRQRKIIQAILVGFFGSVPICGISDILLPFVGGRLVQSGMELHICIVEHPSLIISFAFIGIVVGFLIPHLIEKSTQYSHGLHVLISSMASILYLVSYGLKDWINMIGTVFFITIIAVMIPCCLSDIVFPLIWVQKHTDD